MLQSLTARTQAPEASPAPDRALRIVFSGYRSHPFVGGQGVYAYEVTRALADLGHQVTMVSGPPYPELDPRVALVKLPSLDLFTHDNALIAWRWSFLRDRANWAEWARHNSGLFGEPFAFGLRLKTWLKSQKGQFDVLHDNQGLFHALVDIKRSGLPVTATLHHPISVDLKLALQREDDFWMRQLIRRWHGFLSMQKRVARHLNSLITVSQASRDSAVEDFGLDPKRLIIAPNGVDHSVFHPASDTSRDPLHLVTATSADTPLKGLSVLINALAIARQTHPDIRLTVIGTLRDGPAKAAITHHGLEPVVTFTSGLTRDNIAALYRSAAIAISPSLYEGFGLPAAEAMACGTPVIATDGGALPEVVGDAGQIVPAGDAEALAAALTQTLSQPDVRARMSAACLKRAREVFRWDLHAKACVEAYARAGVPC